MGRSIAHLLDHTAVIWRKSESLGTYGETVKDWLGPLGPYDCTGTRKNAVLANAGPGIVAVGDRTMYFTPGLTLIKRDVIELVSGPESNTEAPVLLEIESVTIPRGNHIEVRVSEYHGVAPEIGS